MIDAHIHLDQYPKHQIDRLIDEWQACGIKKIVAVSTNLTSSYETLSWKEKYPDFIYASVGYHPEQSFPSMAEIDELLSLVKTERTRISAIGEVGLPHYALDQLDKYAVEQYTELFVEFAQLATAYSLPIAIHAVHDKAKPALDILQKNNVLTAHFHWLKAPVDVVDSILQANYFISITPEVCYRERDQKLTKQIPLSQLLLETDGPWPFSGIFNDKTTSPLFLFESASKVASIKSIPTRQLIEICQENALSAYGDNRQPKQPSSI
jgi:TatD DNase family protein